MQLDIFPSGSGDCVLVTSNDGKRLLADAGLPDAYEAYIAEPLSQLRNAGAEIDVAYISHIDRDHIGGVLRLLHDDVKWRAYDHSQASGGRLRRPKVPRPPKINALWHNAFLEDIQRTEKVDLGAALASSATVLTNLGAALPGDYTAAAIAAATQMLALSVGDAIEVNWRAGADQLDIPLNEPAHGGLMTASTTVPALGSLAIDVLGPTRVELEKLKKTWLDWLKANASRLETLRKRNQQDADAMTSGADPLALAQLSREMALAVEKDVTPPNLASLVLLLTEGSKRVLLTGDAGDDSLLKYLKAARLFGVDEAIFVDVLKVPHHGAHNSYSDAFARRVRAEHLIFCGDGEHHNPEPKVVQGYIDAVKANPLPGGKTTTFWFNWSSAHPGKFVSFWQKVEGLFARPGVHASIRHRPLQVGETSMELNLV